MKIHILASLLAIFPLHAAAEGQALSQLTSTSGISTAPQAVPPPSAAREWTVMAYIVGNDRRLARNALFDMNYMEAQGVPNGAAVVAELGFEDWAIAGGESGWHGSRRYEVTSDTDTNLMAAPVSKVLEVLPKADMGDWRHLAEFISWAKAKYPARHYVLYLHSHGSGWNEPQKDKGVAFDDVSGNFMTNAEFGKALRKADGVDVMFSISCLTQMAEVMYELRGGADYAVASEETNLAYFADQNGNKYPTAFEAALPSLILQQDLSVPPELLAMRIAEEIKVFRQRIKSSDKLTMSVVRTSALDELVKRLDTWTAMAEDLDDKEAARAAVRGVLRFDQYGGSRPIPDSSYADLGNFIALYADAVSPLTSKGRAFREASADLLTFITRDVVLDNWALGTQKKTGMEYSSALGLAIVLPPWSPASIDTAIKTYPATGFAKAGSWDRFILKYLWNNATNTGFTPDFDVKSSR